MSIESEALEAYQRWGGLCNTTPGVDQSINQSEFVNQLILKGYSREVATLAASMCITAIIPSLDTVPMQTVGQIPQAVMQAAQTNAIQQPLNQPCPSDPTIDKFLIEPVSGKLIPNPACVDVQLSSPPDMPPIGNEVQIPSTQLDGSPVPVSSSQQTASCPDEISYCRNVYDAVGELTSEIQKAVIESLSTELTKHAAPISHIENVMIGQIQVILNGCETHLGKCNAKVMKPITQALGECYGYLSQCGCCYPTPEQVVYGLNTGNYMESVGLLHPNEIHTVNPTQTNEGEIHGPQMQVQNTTILPTLPCNVPHFEPTAQQTTTQQTSQSSQSQLPTKEELGKYSKEQLEQILLLSLVGLVDPGNMPIPEQGPSIAPSATGRFGNDAIPGEVPYWDSPTVCNTLDKLPSGNVDNIVGFFIDANGKMHAPNWWLAAWNEGDRANWGGVKKWAEQALWTFLHGAKDILKWVIDDLGSVFHATHGLPIDAIFAKVVGGFINHWTEGSLQGLMKGFEYKLNEAAPQEIPSQSDLDRMYLAGQMTKTQWECLTKANNNLPNLAWKNLFAGREHISFADALKLYRLGRMNAIDFESWCMQNGYIDARDIAVAQNAAIDIPSVSDLIRMMVRDVADDNAVNKYGLHAEFDQKWKGDLARFGTAQGIDPEIAKLHWAAHWDQPSNGQAFEMLHRLRPDSKEVQQLDAASKANGGKGVITTQQDIHELLAINDMLPFWRDRMVAISYRPLTRTDAQRAFQLGALGNTPEENESVLQGIYQDEGYKESDAKILVQFTKKLVADRKQRQALPKAVGKAVKYYLDGIHTIDQLEDYLNFLKVDLNRQADILRNAKDERKMIIYKNAIDCIRRSYMLGAFDDVQAKAALVNEGMDANLAIENVSNWWCKKKAKQREITAAKLCEWRDKKLINADQHLRRLVNLGYKLEDAQKIVSECDIDISQRAYKRIVDELKKQQAANEKAAKAAAANEKKLEAAAKKAAKS